MKADFRAGGMADGRKIRRESFQYTGKDGQGVS